ncbi:MAG TPA: glycosyltransferase family 4 protein [Anaerolineae bacterium]
MKIGYLMQAGVPDVRQDPFSGPSVHVRQVITELEKLGHTVRLLACLDGRRIWRSDDLVNFDPVPLPLLDRGPFRWFERVARRFQYELRLPYLALFDGVRFAYACRKELAGYDLFYERMGWMGYGGVIAARWLGIPHILEINGEYLRELKMRGMSPKGLQRWFSVRLIKASIKLTTHIVAAGDGLRNATIDVWHADPAKVAVVENGTQLVSLLGRTQLRSFQSRGDKDVPTLVFLGGFDPWQGVTTLIRATARAIGLGMPLKLLLIGSGPGLTAAQELVRDLGIGDQVTFTGQLGPQDVAAYLARADIGLSPYCGRTEYSGLKLFDYKAAGLATIASGVDGEPRVLEHGRTGWIVPPCDEDALYQAIVKLCSDPDLTRQLGRQARLEAEQQHGWNKTAEQLSELFTCVARTYYGARFDQRSDQSIQLT